MNKYLEKIADFDFDAHAGLTDMASKYADPKKGWSGDLSKFNSVSKRSLNGAALPKPKSGVTSIFKKIMKVIK